MYMENCPKKVILEGGYYYKLAFQWNANAGIGTNPNPNLNPTGHAYIDIDKITRKSVQKNYLYGGGIRIKKIGYFDSDVDKDYYKLPGTQTEYPSKEKIYDYSLNGDSSKSSGSLVFPKPVYEYYKSVKTCIDCGAHGGNEYIDYYVKTNYNNLLVNKTRGSDVGYKNVKIYEKGNGRTEFEYTSSLDFPEIGNDYSSIPPFLPLQDNDFQRGLLISQKDFDKNGRILTTITNTYDVIEYTHNTGLILFSRSEDALTNSDVFRNFAEFASLKSVCGNSLGINYNCPPTGLNGIFNPNESLPICPCHCYKGESVSDFINFVPVIENFGWVKLLSTNSQEYFYDNSTVNIMEKEEVYTYNNNNRKIASQNSTTTDNSVHHITKYFYAGDPEMEFEPYVGNLVANNIIETPLLTETYRNTTLLSAQKTIYNNWGGIYLPEYIATAKGSASLEKRVHISAYDAYGHPIEMQKEDGMTVSYIWGYNNSQLVAKIENARYSSIDSGLIGETQTASNTSETGLETNLKNALADLRNSLPNAMVTTFTYIPALGVRSITDPKGQVTFYEYDSLGRLIRVKDADGNILSDNVYHYKN
ncbi:MAG: RHS repeat protein [Flavobacterium sp.]